MRLPKRVPWSNISELEQVCSWIFAADADASTKILAVNRLAAWKVATALPHALESTLSLLTVILQDADSSNTNSRHAPTLSLRQSYSLALIRLVNGLVDPLQRGVYARPIASLAVQIGLPLWFVELRHASTHEELPSLELLREGARDAMLWLLHNYFLPTLSPSNQSAISSPATLSPLSPILAEYKQLLKTTTRDASLKARSKPELTRILRAVERWISEAMFAASTAHMDSHKKHDEEDERERWALEQFCNELISPRGLVPVAKRKRPTTLQNLTVPTPQYIALWSPLILHVHSRHPPFPSVLVYRIIAKISSKPTAPDSSSLGSTDTDASTADPTYNHTLASWALWIVHQWGQDPSAETERGDVIRELLLNLGRGATEATKALLTALTGDDPRLKESVSLLSTIMRPSSLVPTWEDDSLDIMSKRLSSLRPDPGVSETVTLPSPLVSDNVKSSTVKDTPLKRTSEPKVRGWRLLDETTGWKPCPIGVFQRPSS